MIYMVSLFLRLLICLLSGLWYTHVPKFTRLYVLKTCTLFYVNYASLNLEKTNGMLHNVSKAAETENSASSFSALRCLFLVAKAGSRVLGGEVTASLQWKGMEWKERYVGSPVFLGISALPPDVHTTLRRKWSPNRDMLIPRCRVSSALSFVSRDNDAGSVGRFTPPCDLFSKRKSMPWPQTTALLWRQLLAKGGWDGCGPWENTEVTHTHNC